MTTIITPCSTKLCTDEGSDLTQYNLQDSLLFNGVPLSRIMLCPSGFYCAPGTFPRTVTYPPGTFYIPYPPTNTGFGVVLRYQGCESLITRSLPEGATSAQISSASQEVFDEAADQQARCDATEGLTRLPAVISLSAIDTYTCEDVVFSDTITASGGTAPYTFTSDDLPGWLTPSSTPTTTTLSGTPPTIGAVTFTINVTSSGGNGSRTYTLNVVGIATASLTNGTKDSPYSETMTAPSIPGTLAWSVSAGTLPTGLSLDTGTGEIYGTPTVEETQTFTISVTNGTVTCSKEFDLEIEAAVGGCDAFQDFIWNSGTTSNIGTGTASGTCLAENFNIQAQEPGGIAGAFASDPQKGEITFLATFNYTGGPLNCCINFTFTGTATVVGVLPSGSGSCLAQIQMVQDGNPVANSGLLVGNGAPQILSTPITLADSPVASVILVQIVLTASGTAGFGNVIPAMSATIVGSFGDC